MNWIIVADTNTDTLQEAGKILCKQRMRVTGFKSGKALMDFLGNNRPDMILLGNAMWEIGGFEAIPAIRRMGGSDGDIPVILIADQEEIDLEDQAQMKGACGVISKPLTSAALIPLVRSVFALQEHPDEEELPPEENTIEMIASGLEENSNPANGIWMGKKAFGNIYRHMLRYLEHYSGIAFQVLFTVDMTAFPASRHAEVMVHFRQQVQRSMQDSDMMMENGENQIFLLLTGVEESEISGVISEVIDGWKQTEYGLYTEIACEVRRARLNSDEDTSHAENRADWVVVVDDDIANLKMAGLILSRNHMRVTALKSGRALLKYVKNNKPDLILLDVRMPEMDGFETLRLLKQQMEPGQEIPIIFLTADENAESEKKGLNLGAMDFIKKPFVPDVLVLRVRHIIELVRLQRNLTAEVEIKTQENENLSLRVVQTLADAIDAKDTYTNGHSSRVAEYALRIARRYGYNREQQDEIYMAGLLHDVGKIGVPDSVINKPSRLTEEEYAQIKTHVVMGDRILKNIWERPKLAIAARWHHERYDGTGYPDGLSGDDIPEEARIIAVADAYDAMSSNRSYRNILSQATVRREIENGKGTQFDPVFADIMLRIIAEDPEYKLRES